MFIRCSFNKYRKIILNLFPLAFLQVAIQKCLNKDKNLKMPGKEFFLSKPAPWKPVAFPVFYFNANLGLIQVGEGGRAVILPLAPVSFPLITQKR